jgi:two-component system sensor histidine kinase KdpD
VSVADDHGHRVGRSTSLLDDVLCPALEVRQNAEKPVLVQRVLVNLLTNAVRHAPAGTLVRISTSRLGSRAQIRVVDHGAGVAPDRRSDIFAPFQRLGDTDNTTGVGLGLALSKGFVEAMGGTLEPEDTPGGGLTMVIDLPAVP